MELIACHISLHSVPGRQKQIEIVMFFFLERFHCHWIFIVIFGIIFKQNWNMKSTVLISHLPAFGPTCPFWTPCHILLGRCQYFLEATSKSFCRPGQFACLVLSVCRMCRHFRQRQRRHSFLLFLRSSDVHPSPRSSRSHRMPPLFKITVNIWNANHYWIYNVSEIWRINSSKLTPVQFICLASQNAHYAFIFPYSLFLS